MPILGFLSFHNQAVVSLLSGELLLPTLITSYGVLYRVDTKPPLHLKDHVRSL